MVEIGVGIYGINGHQIHRLIANTPGARLVAAAGVSKQWVEENGDILKDVCLYETLEELLEDGRVNLVSLCSPMRKRQAEEAVLCLRAGKHVYAEKPCAMTEEALDRIMKAALETGCRFHEMAGTAFEQPYLAMRQLVQNGILGDIVQVFAQKSYPYHDGRPQNEDEDGGLIAQNGIHALRFIEHVTGVHVKDIYSVETALGNPVAEGGLQMASSMMAVLENGGVACIVANYLNPRGFGVWGNETLRIFGTKGFVESVDGGKTRLVLGSEDKGGIDTTYKGKSYLQMLIDSLLGRGEMPLPMEEELHPTRMVIRAKRDAVVRKGDR